MPSAHWHPGATLGALSATWTPQERETGKRKADNARPGILLMWVLRAPPESGLRSRQDVFNEPQRVSTVASQQPSSCTTRSGQRDGKPGAEFIKSRKRCLRNRKSNGWHDLRKLLWPSDSLVKSSSQEEFSPLSRHQLWPFSTSWVLLLDPDCRCRLTLPATSTGWRCCRVPPQGQFMSQQQRKTAPIIIAISANCGDGSVTVSFDTPHIVSLTPNCCSRPCQGRIPQNSPGLILRALVKLEMNND